MVKIKKIMQSETHKMHDSFLTLVIAAEADVFKTTSNYFFSIKVISYRIMKSDVRHVACDPL